MSAALTLAELELNDPRTRTSRSQRRFLCPFCGADKPRDAAHRSLSLNVQTGRWICHRCGERGLLNEFSAMVAFCYNVGSAKTRGSSIVKRVNKEDRPGAANAFLLWNRMNGVVMEALAKRRARERTLFLTP